MGLRWLLINAWPKDSFADGEVIALAATDSVAKEIAELDTNDSARDVVGFCVCSPIVNICWILFNYTYMQELYSRGGKVIFKI